MGYINESLIFESDKIYYSVDDITYEVMMDWETPLMEASANYVCKNGGDILEIGFGMGISANFIQSNNINSHTIIENHPDILPKLYQWASDKPNVTIVEGNWYQKLNTLSTYDGLFYDTFGDDDMVHFNTDILKSLVKVGGVATWWNSMEEESNFYNIPNVTYDVYNVSPPQNNYFNNNKYYLPKCQHQ